MKNLRASALAFTLAGASLAAAQLGGKPEVAGLKFDRSAPLVDGTALLQLVLALGVVYALVRYVFPRALAKLGNRLTTGVGGTIKTLETASCGTSTLQVVEVRGKTLLVAINPTGVNLISDLTPTGEPEPDEQPAFFEVLDARKQRPVEELAAKAVVAEAEPTVPEPDDFEASLRLLTEAKQKMAARQQEGTAVVDMDARKERLRRLTG